MFHFEKEQVVYKIGKITIGGSPGENPTVLAGTMFYDGHKIVEDAENGKFDREKAESLIKIQEELSETTGNPHLIQIVSSSSKAVTKYLDFVSDRTSVPILIDSTSSEVRLEGLRYAEEVGLLDNVIYNSLNVTLTSEEITALRELRPESAVVLAFNPQDFSVSGRQSVLETGALNLNRGLLEIASEIGVQKPLVDVATTSLGAGAGSSVAFVFVSKAVYGLPTGSGVHNAPASWPWLRKYKKKDREAFYTCDAASSLLVLTMGADFILYGPIENAGRIFPVAAMGDVFSAEMVKTELGIEPSENHPYRKLL